MAPRITLLAPALICTMFVPALALAAPAPEDGVDAEAGAASEASVGEAPEAVAVPAEGDLSSASPVEGPQPAPAEAPAVAEQDIDVDDEPFEDDDDYVEDDYDYDDGYVEKRTTLELESGYIGLGIAPGMTIYPGGFHPNTRFELEFGGTLEHEYRDLALSFGVVTHLTPYYERKKPSYGADVTATAILGPVYLRTGLGALGGLPRGHLLEDTAAGIGGVVGAGLTFGREPMVRVGVDYDFRVTTRLEPVHTVFLAVRLACCRSD